MATINIRGVEIGAGIPKICVPIVGVSKEEILEEAKSFSSIPVDLVEWRADWYEDVFDFDKVLDVLKNLREILGNLPLLMTFRTINEGGKKSIDTEKYSELNILAAQSGYVDLIDVEIFTGDEVVKEIIHEAHDVNVKVIGSNHDFEKTPDFDDILERLCKMQDLNVDIPKIAVMPNSRIDVLTLLVATEEMSRKYADRPIITMSMNGEGVISRLCGEVFGSAITFGAVNKASAPGQINVSELSKVLEIIHNSL